MSEQEPLIPAPKWDEAALPEGFTAADGVAIMAIESGMSLQSWQFDALARFFATCPACLHGVEAHRVADVCVADDCNCQEKP